MGAEIQHIEARRLLEFIWKAYEEGETLTYKVCADFLQRDPNKEGRVIGGICDLLDAAAIWAGRPLLALIVVRENDGHYNSRAWSGADMPLGGKAKIIAHSEKHRFNLADFHAIERALDDLSQYGNKKAWQHVWAELGDETWYRLTGHAFKTHLENDALNDLGSDVPARVVSLTATYARDPRVRDAVKRRAEGKCEYCGRKGFKTASDEFYIETHHVIALADDGEDRITNVIALCPEHHREAHYGEQRARLESEFSVLLQQLSLVQVSE
jgi:hypothetical protein